MYSLQMIILWICIITIVVVFGLMTYTLIRHHKTQEKISRELFWAAIPLIILILLVIPAVKTLLH